MPCGYKGKQRRAYFVTGGWERKPRKRRGKRMVRRMRTNGHIGSRIKQKWGKIGAPHSAKRKRYLANIRKKRR